MKVYATSGEDDADLDIFTDKQCHVLDLLIEHKTSKEIARTLGISPYTVDQRISLARAKLGVSSRSELAARYRAMRQTLGRAPVDTGTDLEEKSPETIYEDDAYGSTAVDRGRADDQATQKDRFKVSAATADGNISCPTTDKLEYRVGPEVFEGRFGGLWRLGAIVATALLLVMTILGLFAIFNQINDMLA